MIPECIYLSRKKKHFQAGFMQDTSDIQSLSLTNDQLWSSYIGDQLETIIFWSTEMQEK